MLRLFLVQVLLLSSAHASSQTITELHQVSTEEFVTKDSTSGSAVTVGTPQVLLLSSAHASSQTITELHQVSTEEFVTKDSTSGSAVTVGTPQVLLLSSAHASSQTITELHQVSTEEFVTKDSTSGSAVTVGTPQVHGYRTSSTVTSSALGPINSAPHPCVFSGHGESAAGKVLKMLRLFLVQVSYVCTIRSDDRFLVLLPCPRTCLGCAYSCYCSCMLLVCGDIEMNPGPTVDEMFQRLIEGQKDIRSRLEATERALGNFGDRLNKIEANIKDLQMKTDGIDNISKALNGVQDALTRHQDRLDDLEDRSRRSNLIVFGVKEDPIESESDLRRKVIDDLFSAKLGVQCSSVARIHRLGKSSSNRPVIMYFQDYREKQAVWSNVSKLKGKNIRIDNDYCAETLCKRKHLWQSAKLEKKAGSKISLVYDKLKIDGRYYKWDAALNSRTLIERNNRSLFES
nr:uncharacterized protein LOC129384598 isoform X2 [Dermacentor andersoni]